MVGAQDPRDALIGLRRRDGIGTEALNSVISCSRFLIENTNFLLQWEKLKFIYLPEFTGTYFAKF